MLLGWWIFLYAFIVFPHEYVVIDVNVYDAYYDHLYLLQNALFLAVLTLAAWTTSGDGAASISISLWAFFYAVGSQLLDRAVASGVYYSGSLYDLPLFVTVTWMAATVLSAREWNLRSREFNLHPRWRKLLPRLAMLALLSLPVLGLWAVLLMIPQPLRGPFACSPCWPACSCWEHSSFCGSIFRTRH